MKNIILTLLSIPKVGKKSVGYFIKYMQEIPKNENDIIDIFIDIKNDAINTTNILINPFLSSLFS